jgi:hypothetical protein
MRTLCLILLILVSACNERDVPPAPDVNFCLSVNTGSAATDYFRCKTYVSKVRSRIRVEDAVGGGFWGMPLEDQKRLIDYVAELRSIAQQRCR